MLIRLVIIRGMIIVSEDHATLSFLQEMKFSDGGKKGLAWLVSPFCQAASLYTLGV